MADYNPNTIAAYQQYGQSMTAGGGGRNMSGLGARTSTSSMTTAPSGAVDFTTIDTKTGTQKKVATIDYGSDNDDGPISPTVIYAAAANAATEAGTVFAPTGPMANAMNLYSMPNMVEQASDYVYRADRDDAITSAIRSTQQEEQASVDAAISSINRAITLGKTDEEIAEAFLNDMGGFGNDKPDETGGFGVPGVTLKDVTGTDEGALSNPQPLYDFAEEMRNPSITVEELPPMSPDEQASLGEAIRKAAEDGTLSSKLTNIQYVSSDGDRTDPSYWARILFPDDVNEEGEQIVDTDVDPETGQQILSAEDVAERNASEAQGLMSRTVTPDQREALLGMSDITKSQQTSITANGRFNKNKLTEAVKTSVGNANKRAALEGMIDVEVGTAGPITETSYSINNLANFTGAWRERSIEAGLLDQSGRPTQLARDLNRQGQLGDTIFDVQYAGRNGNGDIESGDGSTFKGRGLVQLTGRGNYQAVQDRLQAQGIDIDLINNPELVNDNRYALPAALAYLDHAGFTDEAADTMSARSLQLAINPAAPVATAEERWEAAITALRAEDSDAADEMEKRNEYAAQRTVGTTVDGIIGNNSVNAMRSWLDDNGIDIPNNATKMDLVVLVNENS